VSTEQFIASLVDSLAWPVALVLVAVVSRDQLRGLLTGQLRRLKAGPIEAEFDRLISHVRTEVPPVQAVPEVVSVSDVAGTSPRAAILKAHERIEALLGDALEQAGEHVDDADSAAALARRAGARGLITPQSVNAVEGLAVMRNLAAHDISGEVTPARAAGYLVLADNRALLPESQSPAPSAGRRGCVGRFRRVLTSGSARRRDGQAPSRDGPSSVGGIDPLRKSPGSRGRSAASSRARPGDGLADHVGQRRVLGNDGLRGRR